MKDLCGPFIEFTKTGAAGWGKPTTGLMVATSALRLSNSVLEIFETANELDFEDEDEKSLVREMARQCLMSLAMVFRTADLEDLPTIDEKAMDDFVGRYQSTVSSYATIDDGILPNVRAIGQEVDGWVSGGELIDKNIVGVSIHELLVLIDGLACAFGFSAVDLMNEIVKDNPDLSISIQLLDEEDKKDSELAKISIKLGDLQADGLIDENGSPVWPDDLDDDGRQLIGSVNSATLHNSIRSFLVSVGAVEETPQSEDGLCRAESK